MKRKKTTIGLVLAGTLIGLIPARTEACDFFRRLFRGRDYETTVAPPAISPGVPVYSEEPIPYEGTTAYYYPGYRTTTNYYPATRTYYYRAPVRYYYRVPSTTAYYEGTGCSTSRQPTEAPAPEPESASPEQPQTYAPEDALEPTQQQLRKPTPAEEQSGRDDASPADSDADSPQAAPLPEIENTPDDGGLQNSKSSQTDPERSAPRNSIAALPATPRTVDASIAKRPTLPQTKRRVAYQTKPRWVPVPRETSVAKR